MAAYTMARLQVRVWQKGMLLVHLSSQRLLLVPTYMPSHLLQLRLLTTVLFPAALRPSHLLRLHSLFASLPVGAPLQHPMLPWQVLYVPGR